jgi:hypothetical protein
MVIIRAPFAPSSACMTDTRSSAWAIWLSLPPTSRGGMSAFMRDNEGKV